MKKSIPYVFLIGMSCFFVEANAIVCSDPQLTLNLVNSSSTTTVPVTSYLQNNGPFVPTPPSSLLPNQTITLHIVFDGVGNWRKNTQIALDCPQIGPTCLMTAFWYKGPLATQGIAYGASYGPQHWTVHDVPVDDNCTLTETDTYRD